MSKLARSSTSIYLPDCVVDHILEFAPISVPLNKARHAKRPFVVVVLSKHVHWKYDLRDVHDEDLLAFLKRKKVIFEFIKNLFLPGHADVFDLYTGFLAENCKTATSFVNNRVYQKQDL